MFLQYFKIKRNNYKKQALSNYEEIVNLSNQFIKNSLYDKNYNFDEVFEIFSIITVFYLKKLKDTNKQKNNEISQRIIDSFINDLDQSFREKGIGDMSIGKYVKKYVKKFYYRLKILDKVLNQNENFNLNNYIKKFGISDHGNINKITEDLKILYGEIVIDEQ